MNKDIRPWGYYNVLGEANNYKSKYIYVEAGKKLSYQRHKYRNEHWFIVSGTAKATIEGKERILKPGSYISISAQCLHRIEALEEPVEFIEVQTGTYFGEDDIERVEDDYGR